MSASEYDIVVAGAGIAGLATALGFARHGWRVLVLDRQRLDQGRERGDVIHVAGWHALRVLGATDMIERSGVREVNRFEVWDERRRNLAAINLALLDPPAALRTIPYSELRRCLIAACQDTGKVDFSWNVVVSQLVTDHLTGRVTGVVTPQGEATASLVVIATGSADLMHSRYFNIKQRNYRQIFISAHGTCRSNWLQAGLYVLSARGVLIAVPLSGNRLRLGFQVGAGKQSITDLRAFAQEAELRLPGVMSQTDHLGDLQRYALRSQLAEVFAVPGAVLCGDAAHTVHPAGGQGMNLALVNAVRMVQQIALKLPISAQLDAACLAWAREARARAKRVQTRAHILSLFAGNLSPRSLHIAKGLVKTAGAMPGLKPRLFTRFAYLA